MKYINTIFIFLLFFCCNIRPQKAENPQKTTVELFPAGLHFKPLKGNYQEARMGILYYPSDANLKVDIGNSVDLLGIIFPSSGSRVTLGVEFMAYARSTSFQGHRLQIDAIDGLFGGSAAFSTPAGSGRFLARFRIIHNSAHLVDGHYDLSVHRWIDDLEPIPFTRDFGELIFAYESSSPKSAFRFYAGPLYSTLVRPSDMDRFAMNGGVEYAFINPAGKFFNNDENLFFSYNYNFTGSNAGTGNQNLMAGIKLGSWEGKGVELYANYYKGKNIISEYFRNRIERFGFGFLIDF